MTHLRLARLMENACFPQTCSGPFAFQNGPQPTPGWGTDPPGSLPGLDLVTWGDWMEIVEEDEGPGVGGEGDGQRGSPHVGLLCCRLP